MPKRHSWETLTLAHAEMPDFETLWTRYPDILYDPDYLDEYVCTYIRCTYTHTHMLFRTRPGTQDISNSSSFRHTEELPCPKPLVGGGHMTGFSQWNASGISVRVPDESFCGWHLPWHSGFPCPTKTRTIQTTAAPFAWALGRCQHDSESGVDQKHEWEIDLCCWKRWDVGAIYYCAVTEPFLANAAAGIVVVTNLSSLAFVRRKQKCPGWACGELHAWRFIRQTVRCESNSLYP